MDNNDDTPLLPQLGPSAIEIPENPRRRERNWKINIYLVLVSLFVFLGAIVGISLLLLGHNRNHIPKLTILISLDGTRPEYLTRKLTPRLSSLSEGGIYSEMIPEFPSITFPNHYTIVTGLHPESHGYFLIYTEL
jgi:predicted AlkP superfamily pyrophosphatase or phosphodiesterase